MKASKRTSLDRFVPEALNMFGNMLILFQANPDHVARGTVGGLMDVKACSPEIGWRTWSKEAFEEARRTGKLVLLDLSADWCHWCHVMDRTTYSDHEVIRTVNTEFVPVRVDIDARPDISDRYNRGGFPTTAFLSDLGESIWGATYVPPKDMKRILGVILSAKASGEVADALERSRAAGRRVPGPTAGACAVDDSVVGSVLEDILAAYDVEHGGFGLYPKFPHPDVLDLLLTTYLRTGHEEFAEVVRHTIASMTLGLHDKVEGGMFRYSVTRDWSQPHYEKMLETNAGFLRNLTAAHRALGPSEYRETASSVAEFLVRTLRDPGSGGFFGSQDADEGYYRLDAGARARATKPSVVRAIYGGWNAEAVSALAEAGAVFRRRDWIDAAVGGWGYALARLWDRDMGLMKHEDRGDLYLFDDQVSFLEALLSMYSFTGDPELLGLGHELVSGIERHFPHEDGGYADIMRTDDAVGDLGERRRPLVANSRYARLLALFSVAAHGPDLADRPKRILDAFSCNDLEAHGLFAAEYLTAWHVLKEGAKVALIRPEGEADALGNTLWLAAKGAHNPAVLCAIDPGDRAGPGGAVLCTQNACSEVIHTAEELVRRLGVRRAVQA